MVLPWLLERKALVVITLVTIENFLAQVWTLPRSELMVFQMRTALYCPGYDVLGSPCRHKGYRPPCCSELLCRPLLCAVAVG